MASPLRIINPVEYPRQTAAVGSELELLPTLTDPSLPILAPLDSIGDIEFIRERTSGPKCHLPSRSHQLFTVAHNGFRRAIEITDPVDNGARKFNLLLFLGYTQHVESGSGQALAWHYAHLNPEARIIAIGSTGIGPFGDTVTWRNQAKHGLDDMCDASLAITKALCGDEPVISSGVSMGGDVSHGLALRNLTARAPINLVGQAHLSSAVIPPEATKHLERHLVGSMIQEQFVEVGNRALRPRQLVQQLGALAAYSRDVVPVVAHEYFALEQQRRDLHRGRSIDEVARVAEVYPLRLLTGVSDPLHNNPYWDELTTSFPDMVSVSKVPGGHGLFLEPDNAAYRMDREIAQLRSLA